MHEVNVRVAVRVRPLLPKEKINGEQVCVRVVPDSKQVILHKDRCFTFDNVFPPRATQDDVYNECVEPLVQTIFDGYNATIFAYGQTGAGKTYTVGGNQLASLTDDEYGIIPRALKQMFRIMESNTAVQYSVRVSYIEIYREELQDLLAIETPSKAMHIREDKDGNTVIQGMREVTVTSLDEVLMLLESGSSVRHTASTKMNEESSRSHSIFTIIIGQRFGSDGETPVPENPQMRATRLDENCELMREERSLYISGKFHFVDLAGSERAEKTGNIGTRMKESIHINTGLLCLGNVISALGDCKVTASHIPYRDSKITRILKDSLGGNAKTLMICCVSPAWSNLDETLNALKYANRARNIKNKPIINKNIQSDSDGMSHAYECEIKALREVIARQRTQMFSAAGDNGWDIQRLHEAEDKLISVQTELSHYQAVTAEAYKHLMDIKDRTQLTSSQQLRLRDWLDLVDELKNKVPSTLSREEWESQTIKDLQTQLQKCKADLHSDEVIFADKTKEMTHMSQKVEDLEELLRDKEREIAALAEKCQKYEQQMVQQQVQLDELQNALKHATMRESSLLEGAVSTVRSSLPPPVSNRPKSVPVHLQPRPGSHRGGLRPPTRNIKSSPAVFSLDRVMQSFRARSQLLVSRLEDSDEVLHQTFSDDNSGNSEDELNLDYKRLERRSTFRMPKKQTSGSMKNLLTVDTPPEPRRSRPDIRSSTRILRASEVYSEAALEGHAVSPEEVPAETSSQLKKVKEAQYNVKEADSKIRDLTINIRMKEELIRCLVKNGKDVEVVNHQYAEKISALEKEKNKVKQELQDAQAVLVDLESTFQQEKQQSAEKLKEKQEYKKKVETFRLKMAALTKKQEETEKVVHLNVQSEIKIGDLKQQLENAHKRLKDEMDQKSRLERDLQKELTKVKELQIRTQQQEKILRRKNEEIAFAQRKLRSGSLPPIHMGSQDKLEEQKKWLDSEIEKVLQQRKIVEDLEEELRKREEIVAKKEAMLSEKSELELKKLRSSRVLNSNLLSVSKQLDSVDRQLEEKKHELSSSPEDEKTVVKEEIAKLRMSREKLHRQRGKMEMKMQEGCVLSPAEERRLLELDEAIEALDTAMQYKNEVIVSRQMELRQSQILSQSEGTLLNRLSSLSASETKALLSRYFDKVLDLREAERKHQLQCSELEVKTDEQERIIREMESALHRSAAELERKLMLQQREYEQKIQVLMHQLSERGDVNGVDHKSHDLEKELYYYKKTCRDLKKKIRDLMMSGDLNPGLADELGVRASVQSIAESENGGHHHHHHVSSSNHVSASRERPGSGRDSRPTSAKHSVRSVQDSAASALGTPVKISRKDLRQMSEEEVHLRRSNLNRSSASGLHDSLE